MIRDQNCQIFESFKRQAEGVFDALLTKSQSIWSAIGNSLKTALLLLAALTATLSAGTQIQDTGYTAINGGLFNGRITITSPNMTTADGRTLYRAVQSFTITNGVISVNLEPNDTATPPGTSYYVVYHSTTGTA